MLSLSVAATAVSSLAHVTPQCQRSRDMSRYTRTRRMRCELRSSSSTPCTHLAKNAAQLAPCWVTISWSQASLNQPHSFFWAAERARPRADQSVQHLEPPPSASDNAAFGMALAQHLRRKPFHFAFGLHERFEFKLFRFSFPYQSMGRCRLFL